jgi:hypothetical protein
LALVLVPLLDGLQFPPQQAASLAQAEVAPFGRQQAPASQTCSAVQVGPLVQVPPQPSPWPLQVCPHWGVQQVVPLHTAGDSQSSPQVPPQPLLAVPQLLPQTGVQQLVPSHTAGVVQPSVQVPPQPSLAPPQRLVQSGVQQALVARSHVWLLQPLQTVPAAPQC